MTSAQLRADEISADFLSLPLKERLQLLLEFSDGLPALPERYADHPDLLERVEECQAPVFLFVEVASGQVSVFFSAPPEAPTTRGFAGILSEVLDGAAVDEVLAFSEDFASQIGLAEAVSPLRMRGMRAMLARVKRQVTEKS